MEQTGLFHGQYFVICQVIPLYLAMSQGSPTLIFINGSDPLTFKENTTSEVYFSLEDVNNHSLFYIIFVNHKSLGSTVSRLKCVLNKTTGNCSSSSQDCECLNKTAGHEYRLKKVFQVVDSGEWTFVAKGKGFSVQKSINVTVVSPEDKSTTSMKETTESKTGLQESSQMTFTPVKTQTTVSTDVNTRGSSSSPPASGSPNGWHIAIIVLATCLVIVVFGLVVACTTWRCAYVHLERRNSERLACLAGVDMADSQWRLTMEPVYDIIPTNSRRWRKADRDHLTSTPTTP